jgi:RNA polymerase sigma-70 factor, ECF subfamily
MNGAERFEAFVRKYQGMVYAGAVRLLGNRTDAEDVAQSVFLKAFQRFGDIAESPAAPGWLKTVTRNECLNHLTRHRARWQLFSELERSDEEVSALPYESFLVSEASPSDRLEQDEARAGLERALGELPAHQRVPLVLFHFDEMSYQQIAIALGVSVSKVKTDIHRGREALKKHLSAGHGSH